MTYCHVSNQLAWHANKPEPKTFGDLGEWEQEYIVTELSESVLSDKASLKWVDYPHVIDADFAMSGKMWCVLMVVFLIFPHELFVELFSSWFDDIRRLHVGVP